MWKFSNVCTNVYIFQYDSDYDLSTTSSEKPKSYKNVLVRFANKTSMTGVAFINSARRPISKILWSMLLVVAVGVMFFHLTFLFKQYYQWPKQTKVTLGFSNLQPPFVSICNINPIRKSQIYLASSNLRAVLEYAASLENHTNPLWGLFDEDSSPLGA